MSWLCVPNQAVVSTQIEIGENKVPVLLGYGYCDDGYTLLELVNERPGFRHGEFVTHA